MFSYYGSKSRIAHLYPKPEYNEIIEPFAGSAQYSLQHWEHDITLCDKNEIIVGIWKYLQACSIKDIQSLPVLRAGDKIDRTNFDCIEQANLMGFLINGGAFSPALTMSTWGEKSFSKRIKFICDNLYKIKHWRILQADYQSLPKVKGTWFIDPPYQVGGHKYLYGNKKLNYTDLGTWCRSREGQVIVCENDKAKWLPFKDFQKYRGVKNVSNEVIFVRTKKGRKAGTAKLTDRLEIRCDKDLKNKMAWLKQNERSVYSGMDFSKMIHEMVENAIAYTEVANGQRFDPEVKY